MSLLTQAYLLEKYGVRLNMEQLAEALGVKKNTIYHWIVKGTMKVKTYEDGQRWCDVRDLADYLDACRAQAQADCDLEGRLLPVAPLSRGRRRA